jgi:hypothetical protein
MIKCSQSCVAMESRLMARVRQATRLQGLLARWRPSAQRSRLQVSHQPTSHTSSVMRRALWSVVSSHGPELKGPCRCTAQSTGFERVRAQMALRSRRSLMRSLHTRLPARRGA